MINVAICDDNPLHCAYAEKLVKRNFPAGEECSVMRFTAANDVLSAAREKSFIPQILLTDIEMPGMNGIELAAAINELLPECRIIYLGAYAKYASSLYRTKHIWYVLKGEAEKYIAEALEKACSELSSSAPRSKALLLRSRGRYFSVDLPAVLYLERRKHTTYVVTADSSFETQSHPSEILSGGFEDSFVHCHQSFWVYLPAISELNHDEFLLKNGTVIPISRSMKSEARAAFLLYAFNK